MSRSYYKCVLDFHISTQYSSVFWFVFKICPCIPFQTVQSIRAELGSVLFHLVDTQKKIFPTDE